MFRKTHTQNIINIVVMFICIWTIFTGNNIINSQMKYKENLKLNIETEWRQQAKRHLSNINQKFLYDIRNNNVNPNDELSLQNWAKVNISGILNGGSTGDTFMINLGDEKFIWDGSPDCAKPEFIINGRYMKDEPVMHQYPEQAEYILNKMRLGQSTLEYNYNYWWNFDGSPEYLEWVVIPPGPLGFNDESITVGGIENPNYNKILIALGTQEDEVENTFKASFKNIDNNILQTQIFVCLSLIICIFNMILYIYFNKKLKN